MSVNFEDTKKVDDILESSLHFMSFMYCWKTFRRYSCRLLIPMFIGIPCTIVIQGLSWIHFYSLSQCDLKVSSSQEKIAENFANYFLKTKANNKCSVVLNVHVKGYRKAQVSKSCKIKAQGVGTLQSQPCLKNWWDCL